MNRNDRLPINENLSSMPELVLPKETDSQESQPKASETIKNSIELKLEEKPQNLIVDNDPKKTEIKSEHVSRRNSIEDLAQKNIPPQAPQKKGWFSDVFAKEKKEIKPSEDEESKLVIKEKKDSNPSKEIQEPVLNEGKPEIIENNEKPEEMALSSEIIEEGEEEENAVELSICGHLINQKNEEDLTEIFNSNKVHEELYFKDPIKILSNPNLMVKIDDHLYEWKIAEPLIIAKLVFHQVKKIFKVF